METTEQNRLMWYGHLGRIDEDLIFIISITHHEYVATAYIGHHE